MYRAVYCIQRWHATFFFFFFPFQRVMHAERDEGSQDNMPNKWRQRERGNSGYARSVRSDEVFRTAEEHDSFVSGRGNGGASERRKKKNIY